MISVIVPVYNAERFLQKTVGSVLSQTYKDFELILVDDGSTDNSLAVLNGFAEKDSRVKVIHKENGGVGSARNIGLSTAKGEFVAFLDGDDFLEPDYLSKLYSAIENNDVSFCRFSLDYSDKCVKRHEGNLEKLALAPFDFNLLTGEYYNEQKGDTLFCDRVFGSACRSLLRKEMIEKHGIRFSEKLKIAEDRLFILEYLCYAKTAGIVDEYLYHYVMNDTSATAKTYGKYVPDLAERNAVLYLRQKELAKINVGNFNKQLFLFTVKCNMASEVVQNEIRFNENYIKNLKEIFSKPPYKHAILFSDIFKALKKFGGKKAVYFLLIKLKMWKTIKQRIG